MFKGSFIKLIIGAAILVLSYILPVFMIPIGSYSYNKDNFSCSYSFQLNGKYETKTEVGNASTTLKGYYKLDDKAIYIGNKQDIKTTDINKLAKVKNIYTIEIADMELKNNWALGFTVIGFMLASWGLIGLFVPKKNK
jgi:hypothetical protein